MSPEGAGQANEGIDMLLNAEKIGQITITV